MSIAKEESQFKINSMFDNRWRKTMAFEHSCGVYGGKVKNCIIFLHRCDKTVMTNPNLLKGKSPLQVEGILGKTKGWRIETLGKGSQKGNGWVFREYTTKGNPTGRQLRWHPGGGHHDPQPYWRVKGNNGDLGGIIR